MMALVINCRRRHDQISGIKTISMVMKKVRSIRVLGPDTFRKIPGAMVVILGLSNGRDLGVLANVARYSNQSLAITLSA